MWGKKLYRGDLLFDPPVMVLFLIPQFESCHPVTLKSNGAHLCTKVSRVIFLNISNKLAFLLSNSLYYPKIRLVDVTDIWVWEGLRGFGQIWGGLRGLVRVGQGMVGYGRVWQGMARFGTVWQGMAGFGTVWHGCGRVWQGVARFGTGVARYGTVWQGVAGYGRVWHGLARVWHGMAGCGTVWHG